MTATTEQGATLIMSYAFDHIKGVTTARFTPLCTVALYLFLNIRASLLPGSNFGGASAPFLLGEDNGTNNAL